MPYYNCILYKMTEKKGDIIKKCNDLVKHPLISIFTDWL